MLWFSGLLEKGDMTIRRELPPSVSRENLQSRKRGSRMRSPCWGVTVYHGAGHVSIWLEAKFYFERRVLGCRGQCLHWMATGEPLRFADRCTQLDVPSRCPPEGTGVAHWSCLNLFLTIHGKGRRLAPEYTGFSGAATVSRRVHSSPGWAEELSRWL